MTKPDSRASTTAGSQPADTKRRGLRRLVITLAAIVPLVVGGALTAAAHKTIDLDVDGELRQVSTFAGSVGSLLDDEGIELAEHDVVGPTQEEALRDGELVVVRSATQIEIDVNGETREVWTTALSAAEAVSNLAEAGREVTLTASRSSDARRALPLPVARDEEIEVVADGQTQRIEHGGTLELDDILQRAGISVGKLDEVEVVTGDDGIAKVVVVRVSRELRTETEEVPFETVERRDGSLFVGERRVVEEGAEGQRMRATGVLVVDGEETPGEPSDYITLREPVDRVVAVGTKPRPAPTPTQARSSSGSSSSGSSGSGSSGGSSSGSSGSGSSSSGGGSGSSGGSVSGDVWARLAQCESGGNPTIVSPNGLYHGLYQFSVATWRSVGGSGLPSQASPAEQTQRAQMLQQRSGWGQWPACSARLGLR